MENIPQTSYKTQDVAKMLGCTRENVYRLIREGKLSAFRVGGRVNVRVPDYALREFIERETVKEV